MNDPSHDRRSVLRHLARAGGWAVLLGGWAPLARAADPGRALNSRRTVTEAPTDQAGARPHMLTSEQDATRVATIRYLLDVHAALSRQAPAILETVGEQDLVARVRAARHPNSTAPMPHIINTGAEALLALDAEGLLSREGERLVATLGPDTFLPGALAALRRPDGTLAAVPFHGWPQIIWTRRDWLETEHDMLPPQSLDNLRAAARALYDPERGRRGVILGTTGDFYTQQCFMMIARTLGGSVMGTGDDAGPTLDTPPMVAALEVYADLARHAGPGPLTWRARDYYLQGRAGLLFYSTFLMDDLAVPGVAADSLTGDNFADLEGAPFDPDLVRNTAPVATLDGAVPGQVGAFSSINGLGLTGAGPTTARIAARALALFLFRRDAYIAWLHMSPGGMIPVVRGVIDDDAFMRDRLGVFRTFGRTTARRFASALRLPATFSTIGSGDRAHADPRAGVLYADGVVGRMVVRVIEGSATPHQAARRAQVEAHALLAHGEN
jgi:multiple sugar transport system substrate-binding protein